jgi:hypothetical protein
VGCKKVLQKIFCTHNIAIYQYFTGWWFQPLSEIGKSVGMIIPNIWKIIKTVPNHQPEMYSIVEFGSG